MSSFNRVVLLGNVTKDPEIKYTQSGTALVSLGLAVNEIPRENREAEVSFFEITCWGKTAEIANQYLRKGSPVLIEGRLKQSRWEADGATRSKVTITCERLVLMPRGQPQQHQPAHQQPPAQQTYQPPGPAQQPHTQANAYSEPIANVGPQSVPDDDIPF